MSFMHESTTSRPRRRGRIGAWANRLHLSVLWYARTTSTGTSIVPVAITVVGMTTYKAKDRRFRDPTDDKQRLTFVR